MAAFFNMRRKLMIFVLFLLVLFAFASSSRYEQTRRESAAGSSVLRQSRHVLWTSKPLSLRCIGLTT
jgi:hypothetical protein